MDNRTIKPAAAPWRPIGEAPDIEPRKPRLILLLAHFGYIYVGLWNYKNTTNNRYWKTTSEEMPYDSELKGYAEIYSDFDSDAATP